MVELPLAGVLICGGVAAYRRLTLLHPATLWLMAWATAASLLALRALPYRPLSTTTALIIVGWTALFCIGTLVGSRASNPRPQRFWQALVLSTPRSLMLAAGLAATLAMVGLAAFLLQIASTHGMRAALVSDANVRLAISDGATSYTIKYIYVAFGAAVLAGLVAGRARSARERGIWVVLAMAMVAIQYFSTGRSNLLLAAFMACIAYFLSGSQTVSTRRILAVAGGVAAATLVVFLGMGSLLGKSLSVSDVGRYDNVFVRHDVLQPLALPYQYVTAPLPALDALRKVTPPGGRGGCQTLSPVCAIGQRVGLPVAREPSLTGFTRSPGPWNTFTALYAPLVDAGVLLGSLVIFAQGILFGLLWVAARHGTAAAIGAYAALSSAVMYSTVENTLLQPHLVGAALIVVVLTAAAVRIEALASSRLRLKTSSPKAL